MPQILLIVLLLLSTTWASAQFEDITEQLEAHNVNVTSPTNGYGSGISFYDFNGDGWDDVSIAGGTNHPVFLINNNGVLEPAPFSIPNFGNARIHSMLWVDYDNDGDADLFISRQNGAMQLWQNDGELNFTNVAALSGLEQDNYIYANACWGDYDHDGCLDFYVTKNYSFFNYMDTLYTSQLYKSNCDGTFTEVAAEAGVQLIPRTELQPVWVDVNNDGWEDLFIAVDRLPFQNELFLNNQDGTFTQISESANINDQLDAMGASVADFDHNGYLDIYVGNNPIDPGNAFYQNHGDLTFTNIAAAMDLDLGEESTLSTWGAMFIDYDNDTWEDLFLATMIFTGQPHPGSRLYSNNAGESFTNITVESNINDTFPTETFTVAMGDLNNDGYYDYVTGNRHPYTPRLKRSLGGENNFLSVELEGTLANSDGIGTWIRCYVNGNEYVRYTMCGENLAGQNSSKKIFGLAQYTLVDSLVLDWNSGTHEVYYDVAVNQQLYLIEGASFLEPIEIAYNGDLEICSGDSIVLDGGEQDNLVWNTGDEGQYLTVYNSGSYSVTATNQFGLSSYSDTVQVVISPTPQVDFDVQGVSCTNADDGSLEVSISTGPMQQIVWSTGEENTLVLTGLDGGIYSFTGIDSYGCSVSGEAAIIEPAPLFAQAVSQDAPCFGTATGSVEFQTIGGTPPMTIDWNGPEQNPDSLWAGSYSVVLQDANGCSVPINFTIDQPEDSMTVNLSTTPATNSDSEDGSATLNISAGNPPYSIFWSTGDTDVTSLETLSAGVYTVQVEDVNGCTWSQTFTITFITGTDELIENQLKLFPNPARDAVFISGCEQPQVDIHVFDATGRIVLVSSQHACQSELVINQLSPGTYLLRVTDGHALHTLRMVVAEQ